MLVETGRSLWQVPDVSEESGGASGADDGAPLPPICSERPCRVLTNAPPLEAYTMSSSLMTSTVSSSNSSPVSRKSLVAGGSIASFAVAIFRSSSKLSGRTATRPLPSPLRRSMILGSSVAAAPTLASPTASAFNILRQYKRLSRTAPASASGTGTVGNTPWCSPKSLRGSIFGAQGVG